MKKILIISLLELVLANTVFGQAIQLKKSYPPAGKLIDIGGRKLHIISSGKGAPTIVLVAGAGAASIDWGLVQSRIDSTTRVCSYDRAGLGWSDSGYAEETVEETVNDLHALLKKAGERPPFILVGASLGGIFIQAYQLRFPAEVAGLVFTNSSNHIGFAAKNKSELIWDLTEEEIKDAYPLPAPAEKRPLPGKIIEPYDRLPLNLQPVRLWLAVQLQKKWDKTIPDPQSMLSWRQEFLREFNQSDSAKPGFPLGQLPVVVVSSDPRSNDSLRYSREGAAGRLDFLSENTIHITASGSGHEIQLYQPEALVTALRRIIDAVRTQTRLYAGTEAK